MCSLLSRVTFALISLHFLPSRHEEFFNACLIPRSVKAMLFSFFFFIFKLGRLRRCLGNRRRHNSIHWRPLARCDRNPFFCWNGLSSGFPLLCLGLVRFRFGRRAGNLYSSFPLPADCFEVPINDFVPVQFRKTDLERVWIMDQLEVNYPPWTNSQTSPE